jgi:UDP-glucuronate decarboxylase
MGTTVPDVTVHDLERLTERLNGAFSGMAGSDLLITGGAASSATTSSRHRWRGTGQPDAGPDPGDRPRQLPPRRPPMAANGWTIRRCGWSNATSSHRSRRTSPAVRPHHPRRLDRLADLLPQAPDRDDGRQRRGPAAPPRPRRRAGRRTDAPVRGLLFFSTSEIYGDPDAANIPTPETYRGNVSCTGPRACYDESKRFGETLCVNFARRGACR